MRGKVKLSPVEYIDLRITPAHAGKSDYTNRNLYTDKDHPRTCGEKIMYAPCNCYFEGSPPHMRGKAFIFLEISAICGITPAHAGKRPVS